MSILKEMFIRWKIRSMELQIETLEWQVNNNPNLIIKIFELELKLKSLRNYLE